MDKATPEDYEKNPIEDYEAFRLGIVSGVDFLAKQLNAALDVSGIWLILGQFMCDETVCFSF